MIIVPMAKFRWRKVKDADYTNAVHRLDGWVVLQQAYHPHPDSSRVEWRDVPVVDE